MEFITCIFNKKLGRGKIADMQTIGDKSIYSTLSCFKLLLYTVLSSVGKLGYKEQLKTDSVG